MATIIDKRNVTSDRFYSSRERFMDRNRGKIKEAIDRALGNSSIDEIGKGGVDVTIPKEGINEPRIYHGQGGVQERVLPGNKQFNSGDRLPKPKGGGSGSGGNGPVEGVGKSEDDFVFHLSEEEFLNYLYQDMQLPNLIKEGGEDAQKVEGAGLRNRHQHQSFDRLLHGEQYPAHANACDCTCEFRPQLLF